MSLFIWLAFQYTCGNIYYQNMLETRFIILEYIICTPLESIDNVAVLILFESLHIVEWHSLYRSTLQHLI